ncbi:hypothetical protein F511_03364 [Dorcoceras hygrometricum]|uniref:U3 small nucleolar RNA-associated protein 14 n=1 Tax=Dorcoceras hygrometricum TaxID=472368 RepID=A0A2Z7BLX7_9LAMI|nr:hypothetical protein F511_03364 [Dorcoceras hygrometricum]
MNKKRKGSSFGKSRRDKATKKRDWRGPRLPNAFQKELDRRDPDGGPSDDEEERDFNDVGDDVYEYEEAIPEEESKKNKRFDLVENYQYELPEDFKDENIASDEGEDAEDDGRHARMLQEITGLPSDAFAGSGKKKKDFIISEAYPESEYNPSRDILDGKGLISIQDLVESLHGKSGFSKLRKDLRRMESKAAPIITPLPQADQERVERKAAYEQSKKDITKWEPLVKKNREAPTLYFDEEMDLGFSTIGAIASEFEPRTDFEKKIASLVNHNEVVEAHKKDGARLLELNELSIEDMQDRQDRLAKMRSLLFRHEMKAKRIKKIKSKTYHRLLKKDRTKAADLAIQMDPEAAKDIAMKQEFKRAEERMTLKHKNSSRWAKRILERGIDAQDEGTRVAFAEQLSKHAELTRKMSSMNKSSSSDESSYEDDSDDVADGSDLDKTSKLLINAKEKTRKLLEEDEELPHSGVLSLPFMVRGLKKRKEAADEEANLALKEYDLSLKKLDGKSELGRCDMDVPSGRRVFGAPNKAVSETSKKVKSDSYYANSDSEDGGEEREDKVIEHEKDNHLLRSSDIDPNLLRQEFEINHDSVFKSFETNVEEPEPKIAYDVSFFASDSWKKMKKSSANNQIEVSHANNGKCSASVRSLENETMMEDDGGNSDADSGGEMVDGILSGGGKSGYELPSQSELIQRAFAGDDVEEDFEKDKAEVLNEENPEPEKPVLIPGWGQWTDIQKKKGLPSWMLEEHETAKKKREEALKKRKDAHLNNVIVSEKLDKKAERLHTKSLPYPYTSEEVFEQSIRMPIGPEFNPVSAVAALNRPEVVKRAGVIIKPIKYKDINTGGRDETHARRGQKQKKGKDRNMLVKKKTPKV